jgi:hypothetical protein
LGILRIWLTSVSTRKFGNGVGGGTRSGGDNGCIKVCVAEGLGRTSGGINARACCRSSRTCWGTGSGAAAGVGAGSVEGCGAGAGDRPAAAARGAAIPPGLLEAVLGAAALLDAALFCPSIRAT